MNTRSLPLARTTVPHKFSLLPPDGKCTIDFTHERETERRRMRTGDRDFRLTDHSRLNSFDDQVDSFHPIITAILILAIGGLLWSATIELGLWLRGVFA